LVLGGGMLVIGVPILWFTLPRGHAASKAVAAEQAPAQVGLTFREALAAPRFWMIAATSLLIGAVTGALMVHLASIGLAKGLTTAQVVGAASLIGITAIGGRLLSGYLMDRMSVKLVGAVIFFLPVIAALILVASVTPTSMMVAAVLIGLCGGGDFNVLAMLTNRYLGMRNYAAIYGQIAAAFNIGVGSGPLIAGAFHDRIHTYEPILIGLAVACLVTSLLTLALGAVPRFSEK
jgi:MFS family permease